MNLHFYKYHGAGNDFIMIDSNESMLQENDDELIRQLCDRHTGIGADGLIILKEHDEVDFEMLYFNSDGKPGTMCGNGGRCTVAFAHSKGYIGDETTFLANNTIHHAYIQKNNYIALEMDDVLSIKSLPDGFVLDTGSLHFVRFLSNIENVDISTEGRKIRSDTRFGAEGVNVNFCQMVSDDSLKIITYERGVENETLSCGTGAVASALAFCYSKPDGNYLIHVQAKGGNLEVAFKKRNNSYSQIWLKGPATFVFDGNYTV